MGGHGYMGWWGSMGGPKQKGITSWSISPFAAKPLAGVWNSAIFNTSRRVRSQALFILAPLGLYYYIYRKVYDYNEWLYTKDGKKVLDEMM